MLNKIITKIKEKMLKTVQSFHNDIKGVRSNKVSSSLLDGVIVDVYGGHQKLSQVSNISVIDNRILLIRVWDINIISKVKSAILNSNLSFNPIIEGNTVRIVLPHLTEETRKKLVKLLNQFAENARIAIRNIRREVIEEIEKIYKIKKISEDDFHILKKEIQNITYENIKKINTDLSSKEEDILLKNH